MDSFTIKVVKIIKSIPFGKVMTYGQIAFIAGNPFGARQVSRILHTLSLKEKLPWHRVINSKGMISLGGELGLIQRSMLVDELIQFSNNKIDLRVYGYQYEIEGEKDENC